MDIADETQSLKREEDVDKQVKKLRLMLRMLVLRQVQ